MKTTLNEKIIAYLALLSGLTISAVAIYYSVSGLVAIFAAATIPIIVMGVTLELSKIVASVWLKQNWKTAPKLIKLYLCIAVALLMLITSMGIFGFLSKSHLDQNMPTAEASAQIALLDEKILTEKNNIDATQKVISQMDNAVDQIIGRSNDERGASRSVALRRNQQKERAILTSSIAQSQKIIAALNQEKAPISVTLRQVEAEVGPIKYIAAFFYGATDTAILEKAVTWVIILIIVVFDPLALILLIASQVSFQQFRERKIIEEEHARIIPVVLPVEHAVVESEVYESEAIDNSTVSDAVVEHSAVKEPELINPEHVQDTKYDYDDELNIQQFDQIRSVVATENEFFAQNDAISLFEEVLPVNHAETAGKTPKYEEMIETFSRYDTAPAPVVRRAESLLMKTKVFPRPELVLSTEYIQNEEQQESSKWTDTTTKSISHEEYMNISQDKLEDYIIEVVKQVRSGQLQMSEVPDILLAEIKTRI
jgi:hypothetical protein